MGMIIWMLFCHTNFSISKCLSAPWSLPVEAKNDLSHDVSCNKTCPVVLNWTNFIWVYFSGWLFSLTRLSIFTPKLAMQNQMMLPSSATDVCHILGNFPPIFELFLSAVSLDCWAWWWVSVNMRNELNFYYAII